MGPKALSFPKIRTQNFHMSLEIKIPAVGESITCGLHSVWHKLLLRDAFTLG